MTGSPTGYQPHPFTGGRAAVLRACAEWRRGGEAPRTLAITGHSGSGRSRLVSAFLMLCYPELRQRLPLGDMDPETIPPELPPPLVPRTEGQGATELRWLLDAQAELAAREGDLFVVVPQIDRAGVIHALDEPKKLVHEVLKPLAATEKVRQLLDIPRHLAAELAAELPPGALQIIDLDDPQWADHEGSVRQVESGLDPQYGAPDLPFTTDPEARARLAEAIVHSTGDSPLLMELALRGILRDGQDFDPADESRLPKSLAHALELHAARIGVDVETLRSALVPLALGAPDGIPEGVWRRLAEAAATGQTTGQTTEQATDSQVPDAAALAPFVERHQTREGVRLRLLHPAIAEEIRSGLPNVPKAQTRMAVALLEAVPDQDWRRADAYVRDHIAGHTLEAGILPQLLTDPGLFVHADPARLLAAVKAVPSDALGLPARTYLRTAPLLVRTDALPPLRAAQLETAFLEDGLTEYAEAVRRLNIDLPWQTLWSLPVPGVRGVFTGTLLPPPAEEHDSVPLAAAAAVLVVPASTPGALPLEDGAEAGLLIRDLNRPALLDDPDLDRVAVPSEEVRKAAPLAFAVDANANADEAHAVQVWDRTDDRELTTFHSEQPLVDVDISAEGVLLVATNNRVTALRIRRAPSAILT